MMNEKTLIQQGIQAWQERNFKKANGFFSQAVQINHKSEQGWLWLAKVTESVALRQSFLELVLRLNPQNAEARQMLAQMQQKVTQPKHFGDSHFIPQQKVTQPKHFDDGRFIPPEIRKAVFNRDQGMCVKCRSKEHLEYDHIIPYSKGGANTVKNLQLLCQACNRKKSNRIE